jgi:putative transposase
MTLHNRQTQRLETFDYASHGAYFITVCTQTRGTDWFGMVSRDGMVLNAAGEMIARELKSLPTRFTNLELDEFIVMPDHIHAIFLLGNATGNPNPNNRRGEPRVRPITAPPPTPEPSFPTNGLDRSVVAQGDHKDRPYVHPSGTHSESIGRIVQALKSLTTVNYVRGVREFGWPPFEKRFWQRNYWDRIIRDDAELEATRSYIAQNPTRQFLERDGER